MDYSSDRITAGFHYFTNDKSFAANLKNTAVLVNELQRIRSFLREKKDSAFQVNKNVFSGGKSPFESASGLHMPVSLWPPERLQQCEACCPWTHPSWMWHSLYGASVNRQEQPIFLLCFKVQKSTTRPQHLWLTCARRLCTFRAFPACDVNSVKNIRPHLNAANSSDSDGYKRTKKTSQSS